MAVSLGLGQTEGQESEVGMESCKDMFNKMPRPEGLGDVAGDAATP